MIRFPALYFAILYNFAESKFSQTSIQTMLTYFSFIMYVIVGAEADDDRIELLLSEVKGKDITELIASGREKLASVPSGGGAVAAAAPASGGSGASAAPAAEAKKEEKVEEKEESDDDMGFSLFD
ncbi:hypothetical protein J1N35_031990 [Gossypium stocksii]|uniref:Ribosomal protein 60S n=1 Tax=Gossypium stocksii TaxID=47602 RepID=A0A9D3V2Q2_9ROSI|nr:hypothetical protein J1N35_031990 [Gossypium stocksii]